VLAWLIHHRAGSGMRELAGQVRWTSYLRDELAVAVRLRRDFWAGEPLAADWPVPVKRRIFAGRVTHLPEAAADSIGWPDARRALAYFDRLAAMPVSEPQAMRAAEALAAADAEAAARASAPETAATAGIGRLLARPAVAGERRRVMAARPRSVSSGPGRTAGLLPPPQAAGGTSPAPRIP
jgi:hypothetical protein